MSLKGDLDIVLSHARRSNDPILLERTISLRDRIFQLIDNIRELEKEQEALENLLKKYKKKSKE
jgi:hypothetical protein